MIIGERVGALVPGGGYAEYAVAPVGQCLPVPDGYDMAEAAALPETLFTVGSNLFERAYIVEGDIVLVHGGSSGIGTTAISSCGLFGVKIIVTFGIEVKCSAALQFEGTHAITDASDLFVEAELINTDSS